MIPSSHQFLAVQIQVRQTNQSEYLSCVLRQAPVSGFHVSELAFHDPEDVLHPATDRRQLSIASSLSGAGHALQWCLQGYNLKHTRRTGRSFESFVHITRITDHGLVILANQRWKFTDVQRHWPASSKPCVEHTAVHVCATCALIKKHYCVSFQRLCISGSRELSRFFVVGVA